jgi:hypothetical protein
LPPTPTPIGPTPTPTQPTPVPTPDQPVSCDYEIQNGESLNRFSSTAGPGETVCVHAGIYTETLRPEVSGTAGNFITFRAYPGQECQGRSSARFQESKTCSVRIDGQDSRGHAVDLRGRKFIRIEGFEIAHHADSSVLVQVHGQDTAEGIEVVNNLIRDARAQSSAGIHAQGGMRNMLFENNEIRDVYYGIVQSSLPNQYLYITGVTIRGNNLHHLYCDPISRQVTENLLIEDNWLHDQQTANQIDGCHIDGIDLYFNNKVSMKNIVIRNNQISDSTQLIYFTSCCDNGEMDGLLAENIHIYGNVLYTNDYYIRGHHPRSDGAPGIFIHNSWGGANNNRLRHVYIHSNTIGWLGCDRGGTCTGDPQNDVNHPYSYLAVQVYTDANSPIENLVLRNNIFYHSGVGLGGMDSSEVSSDYNFYYGPAAEQHVYEEEGAHSQIGVNPQFVNYDFFNHFDFRLSVDSPALDAGDPSLELLFSIPSPFVDLWGNPRPWGDTYDIGAYEFQGN